jgi:hypothetical protein
MDEKPDAGVLMLLCAPRKEAISSGVHFTRDDLARMESAEMNIHCPLCSRAHAFKFADAWIARLN